MRPPHSICSTAVEGPLVRVTAEATYDTATVSGHGPQSPARDRAGAAGSYEKRGQLDNKNVCNHYCWQQKRWEL